MHDTRGDPARLERGLALASLVGKNSSGAVRENLKIADIGPKRARAVWLRRVCLR